VTRRPTLARVRRFYWLWGVALPLLVGLGAYGFTPDLAENAMQNHVMKLGFAVGAAVVVFYIVESYYLRRDENRNRRQRGPKGK
jgi:hypothetical protein